MTRVSLVYAQSRNGVIGLNGGLPWRLPSDLKRFKAVTMGKPIIMGRKTWDSLPRKPLPGRPNIVLTRARASVAEGATVVRNVAEALAAAGDVQEVCVIGGAEIYALFLPRADRIYLTEVDLDAAGDAHAPTLDMSQWVETACETHVAQPGDDAGFVLRILDRKPN